MGPHRILMLGDQYIGHFYIDANDNALAVATLDQMVDSWNTEHSR